MQIVYSQLETTINEALETYASQYGVDDFRDVSQNRWNADVLPTVQSLVFPKKADTYIKPNNGYYNIERVHELADLYIKLCGRFDKEVTHQGFLNLSGVNPDTYAQWNKEPGVRRDGSSRNLSVSHNDIHKKIREADEESLHGMLLSGKNPIAVNSVGNHKFSHWRESNGTTITYQKRELLPRRSINEQNDRLEADNMPLLPE